MGKKTRNPNKLEKQAAEEARVSKALQERRAELEKIVAAHKAQQLAESKAAENDGIDEDAALSVGASLEAISDERRRESFEEVADREARILARLADIRNAYREEMQLPDKIIGLFEGAGAEIAPLNAVTTGALVVFGPELPPVDFVEDALEDDEFEVLVADGNNDDLIAGMAAQAEADLNQAASGGGGVFSWFGWGK